MNKVALIIAREYRSRVAKKSFIIMSLVGPILIAAISILPVWFATQSVEETKVIQVLDETGLFSQGLYNDDRVYFDKVSGDLSEVKKSVQEGTAYGVLYIPSMDIDQTKTIELYSDQSPGFALVNHLKWQLQSRLEQVRLEKSGVNEEVLKNLKEQLSFKTITLSQGGEESANDAGLNSAVGYFSSFLIYIFIFMYGVQIMKGIIEEKTNRIIEVIIASVKPIQLMTGKIIGIAGVAFTQFLIWIVLSFTLITLATQLFLPEASSMDQTIVQTGQSEQYQMIADSIDAISKINLPLILTCFLFYFIGGYLFYGSLFAAVGAAVDSDADSQQFMLPITAPLVLSIMMIGPILQDPGGQLAFWTSIIPITSPIVMMTRLPFGVPIWELALSMVFLIGGFMCTSWLASKVYRIGIFVHGTKVNYATLWKWIKMKD